MPNHIQITVNGNTYNNVRAAWRAESPDDLPEITVRKRLAAGWCVYMAFNFSPIEASGRRTFKSFRDQNESLVQ